MGTNTSSNTDAAANEQGVSPSSRRSGSARSPSTPVATASQQNSPPVSMDVDSPNTSSGINSSSNQAVTSGNTSNVSASEALANLTRPFVAMSDKTRAMLQPNSAIAGDYSPAVIPMQVGANENSNSGSNRDVTTATRGRERQRDSTSSEVPPPVRCINPASDINSRLDTQVEVRVYPCNNSQSGGKKKFTTFTIKPEVSRFYTYGSVLCLVMQWLGCIIHEHFLFCFNRE